MKVSGDIKMTLSYACIVLKAKKSLTVFAEEIII